MGGGGAMGAMGLDLAPYKMPIIGGFFQDPNELHAKQQQHEMAMAYGGMRPETQRAQENAMRQASLAMQPYQNLMSMGYGASAATPTEGLMDNPMSQRAMELGNPRGMKGEPSQVPGSLEDAVGLGGIGVSGSPGRFPGMPGAAAGVASAGGPIGAGGGSPLDAIMGGGMGGMMGGGGGLGALGPMLSGIFGGDAGRALSMMGGSTGKAAGLEKK
jgi:hypothetical protein